ncbi:MAG: TauD/TfdA dioxygenase family protein, partial [Stellaceae bacterium]
MEPRSDALTAGAAIAAPPRFTVRKLTPAIGAEIEGVDLSRPLDSATIAAVRQAWHDHAVILLRDQQLSDEDQIRFGECFGTLGRVFTHREGRHPAILLVSNIR